MSTHTLGGGLPVPLARWSETLSLLDPALALTLGPAVRTLDDLIGRLEADHDEDGEMDGYDGTTTRGTPERLLLSEWALAEDSPLEFLRRAAENELLHLRQAYRNSRRRGRVVIACDSGPDQIGPGRLLQLAALVVLFHRATRSGAGVDVHILQTGQVLSGGLAEIAVGWLASRSLARPTREQCTDVLDAADANDRVWFLVGDAGCAPPGHGRVLSSRVADWNGSAATELAVRVGNASARIHLPPGPAAVAALRGEGLVARSKGPTLGTVPHAARGAAFLSADDRLLWRGEDPQDLHSCRVGTDSPPHVKTHRFSGAVLAAAFLGRRLVAAVADGPRLRIRVVGKRIADVDGTAVLLSDIGLDEADVAARLEAPVRPLYIHSGDVVLEGSDEWWNLDTRAPASRSRPVAVSPGHALDAPRFAYNSSELWIDGNRLQQHPAAAVVLGPVEGRKSWHAWTNNTRIWTVAFGRETRAEIAIPEGDTVLGLALLPQPSLITLSSGGMIVRHHTQENTYTWTRFSGPGEHGVHPTRPWLVRTDQDRLLVGDLRSGATLLDLRVGQ